MKRIATDSLVPGMVTADNIYNYNNQLILPTGLVLTDKAISKLHFYAIESVKVEDAVIKVDAEAGMQAGMKTDTKTGTNAASKADAGASAGSVPEASSSVSSSAIPQTLPASPKAPRTPEVSYASKVKSSQDYKQFRQKFDTEVSSYESRISELVLKNVPLDTSALLDDALELISFGNGSFSVFDMLHNMRENDDQTYAHCLNVGLICNVFAGWLGMKEEETRMVTLCGLLHDVGKMKIPDAILRKETKLSPAEYRIIQTHAQESFNMLKDLDIDVHIKNAALMHHERCDGSGYPFGLTAARIDPYAKMVAIADVYDAMTSSRSFRGPLSPFKAISIMQEDGLQKFGTGFIMTFLENVVNTYIGNRVRLNNGQEGEIVFIHKDNITKPTVKCGNTFVDLSANKTLYIETII